MPKCPHCNNEVKEEDAIFNTKTKRYYHPNCYQILLDRKVLCDYICELFKYKKPSVKIYHKKGDINKSQDGIGIIPYVIDEAKEFATLEELEKKKLIEKFENNAKEHKETKIVYIAEQRVKQRKNIDINSL